MILPDFCRVDINLERENNKDIMQCKLGQANQHGVVGVMNYARYKCRVVLAGFPIRFVQEVLCFIDFTC